MTRATWAGPSTGPGRHASVSTDPEHLAWMEACETVRRRLAGTSDGGGLRPDLKRATLVRWLREEGLEIVDASSEEALDRIRQLEAVSWDAIVSGAGPAGLGAAWRLAEKGLRVLLLERALFLDTDRTWAEPDDIVREFGLQEAVRCVHKDTGFKDYFGLDYPSRIDYCILDQELATWTLARKLPRGPFRRGETGEVVVVENCELTAFARVEADGVRRMRARTVRNGFRLLRYAQAQKYPRALALSGFTGFFHAALDPWVKIDTFQEVGELSKSWENPRFHASLLVDAGGHRSALARSYHKARSADVWKCLVYEFEDMPVPQEQTIWDLAFPTASSANFWVDVASPTDAAVGVMVLTRATPELPNAQPERAEMEAYMGRWLNIRRLTGTFVRERSGLIPMTDLREPAAFSGVVFVGASACRQIPNTGFGFFPGLREAALLAREVAPALLADVGVPDFATTRAYDLAWLRENEFRSALALVLQDFHYALRTDEAFHGFSECCTDVPAWLVKNRILDAVDLPGMVELTRVFVRNPQLLDPDSLDPDWMPRLRRDLATLFLSVLQTCRWRRFLYHPRAHRMFRCDRDPATGFLGSYLDDAARFLLHEAPHFLFRQIVARLIFTRPFRRALGAFGGRPALFLLGPLLGWAFGSWKDMTVSKA